MNDDSQFTLESFRWLHKSLFQTRLESPHGTIFLVDGAINVVMYIYNILAIGCKFPKSKYTRLYISTWQSRTVYSTINTLIFVIPIQITGFESDNELIVVSENYPKNLKKLSRISNRLYYRSETTFWKQLFHKLLPGY